MNRKSKIILSTISVLVFLLLLTISYLYSKLSSVFIGSHPELLPIYNQVFEKAENENRPVNVLILGFGGKDHDGGFLTDVLIVLSVDKNNKKVLITSIPRDLWVPIPVDLENKQNFKINNAFAIGGNEIFFPNKRPEFRGESGRGSLAKKVVGDVIGMPVDYFVSVDFGGFVKIIDTLEGIEVNVPTTFDDYFYPVKGLENETCGYDAEQIQEFHQKYSGFELEKQFSCRYEHLHFDKGKVHMDGETALKFVRSRHSEADGGDFARSIRQFEVLNALKDRLVSLKALTKPNTLIDRLSESVRTDVDKKVIDELLDLKFDPEEYVVNTLNLSTDNVLDNSTSEEGQYVLIPKAGLNNFLEIQKLIQENI